MKKIILLTLLVWTSCFIFSGCDSANKIALWDQACISYTWTFSDGTVLETNFHPRQMTGDQPVGDMQWTCFTVGSQQMITGIEKWVIGMRIGKSKTIKITPDKWYGALYDTMKVQKISKFIFDKLKVDVTNGVTTKLWDIEGIIKWTETDGSGNQLVLFDINPRQTWDTLIYHVRITNLVKK